MLPTNSIMSSLTAGGLLFLLSLPAPVQADGRGMIGLGKYMYNPACAFACRIVIRNCPLLCTPTAGGGNHGTAHNPSTTPPECYTSDTAFMRTMAVCISSWCPTSDAPSVSLLEDYWASHLGTGTLANYKWKPTASYVEALLAARRDEAAIEARRNSTMPASGNSTTTTNSTSSHSGHSRLRVRQHEDHMGTSSGSASTTPTVKTVLPTIKARQPLNVTSFVTYDDWVKQYNGLMSFEINENGHSNTTVSIVLVALLVPVLLSLLRFIPALTRSRTYTWLNSMLNHPAVVGTRHREPEPKLTYLGGGIVPTRGQAIYILLLSFLNVIFLLTPYFYIQPQSIYPTRAEQDVATIGNRAGSLAIGNAAALFVFSARNNLLLTLTDWSHGTFLLLHRWLGYWAVLLTMLHSIMLFVYYYLFGDWAAEAAHLYWTWGVVSTVAAAALVPFSFLAVRQRAYELFLSTHHLFTVLFIVGYYYHIWYLYEYNWGYEIWVWIIVAIWAGDRVWRIARTASNGLRRTAVVSAVEGTGGEYFRIEIDGLHAEGVVYLCFPTLRPWLFWENHPFSVASSFATTPEPAKTAATSTGEADEREKTAAQPTEEEEIQSTPPRTSETTPPTSAKAAAAAAAAPRTPPHPRTTFIVRTRAGVTSLLASRAAAGGGPAKLSVLIEGSYRPTSSAAESRQLGECTTILCVAGGVGVTALLPVLRRFGTAGHGSPSRRRVRLAWGVRHKALVSGLAREMAGLPASVEVETSVGARLDVGALLAEELNGGEWGPLGVVVCGPPEMADEVRRRVAEVSKLGKRAIVFVDEAFSW